MMQNQLGIQLYSLRDHFHTPRELKNVLSKVKDAGYVGVELAALDGMPHEDVVPVVMESGLTVIASHIGYDRFGNELDTVVSELRDFHCKNAVVPIVMKESYRSLEGVRRLTGELKQLSRRLKDEGVTLHYHNHNFELCRYEGKPWLRWLLDGTMPQELKAELDVYWIQMGGGDPIQWINDYADRLRLLHLKDLVVEDGRLDDDALGMRLRAGVGAEQRVTEIGNGNLNLSGILRAAKTAGVEWYIVEQDEAYNHSALECMCINHDNLVKLDAEGER